MKLNIILDIDGTLIHNNTPRPHLEYFLEECFKHFKNVSIWTASSKNWCNHVNNNIFQPIIDNINKKHNKTYRFDFVFNASKCTTYRSPYEMYPVTEKRLRKLHRSKRFTDYTVENTLIVDDTRTTYCRCNYGNAIPIKSFYTFSKEHDTELLKLVKYLKEIIIPHFDVYKTIRNIEKRGWNV